MLRLEQSLRRNASRYLRIYSQAANFGQLVPSREHVESQMVFEVRDLEQLNLEEVLALLDLQTYSVSPKAFIHILQLCRRKKDLSSVKHVHKHIQKQDLEDHAFLGNYLIPSYVHCGGLLDADLVFERLTHRNEYSWTALIQGYIDRGECETAFSLYQDMRSDGVYPNTYTFQSLLRGCSKIKSIHRGRRLHCEVANDGVETHPYVGSALVDMYCKCGFMEEAQDVFNEFHARDVVAWTALIGGYAEHGLGEQALSCLEAMQEEGIPLNDMTIVCCVKGCGSLRSLDRGHELHARIIKGSLEGDLFIANALVDMYVKRDLMKDAVKVFEKMPSRDVVSWTALIMGYANDGLGEEAVLALKKMRFEGISPNDATYVCSVKACGGSSCVDSGLEVHAQLYKEGFDRYSAVGNSLVDMYAKCGSLSEAWQTFTMLQSRDLISWSALISGYAHEGQSRVAFELFERMTEECIRPDSVVLLGILNACSHAGLVHKGKGFLKTMEKKYGVPPMVEHYNSVLDLLGRSGRLKEALEWLKDMPFRPNFVSWSTLLGACHKWTNVELGRHSFDSAVKLDKTQITSYVVMSSIYMDAGMWKDAREIDAMRASLCK